MKRKLSIIVVFIISLFLINSVEAEIIVNSNLGTGENSEICNGSICAGTIEGYYGIGVKLCNEKDNTCSNEIKLTNTDFSFTEPNVCHTFESTGDNSYLNYCWDEYFANLTSTELNRILGKIDPKLSIDNSKDKYLIITPMVGISLYFNPNNWGFQTYTYFRGTINEVTDALSNAGKYMTAKNGGTLSQRDKDEATSYGQGFTGQSPGKCSGSHNGIGCGWNVLRNYYIGFKLSSTRSPYNTVFQTNNASAMDFRAQYDRSIYGKIIVDISEYIEEYNICYYSNVGSDYSTFEEDGTYHLGQDFIIKQNMFSRSGYIFKGWKVRRCKPDTNSNTKCSNTKCSNTKWFYAGIGWDSYKANNVDGLRTYIPGEKFNLGNWWIKEGLVSNDQIVQGPYTYIFNAQWESASTTNSTPKLTINKVFKNSSGEYEKLEDTATFAIYTNSNCNGEPLKKDIITSDGQASVELNPGTYYIKETEAPIGYHISNNNCQEVTVNTSGASVIFENESICQARIKSIKENYKEGRMNKTTYIEKLIRLYSSNLAEGKDFRNILNFKNPTCSVKTCMSSQLSVGCLNARQSIVSFNENNLSCYDEMINSDSKIGFCKTGINLSNFLNITGQTYKFKGISGQLLISQNKDRIIYFNNENARQAVKANFLTANVKKICYIINDNNKNNIIDDNNNKNNIIYNNFNKKNDNIELPLPDINFGDNDNDGVADDLHYEVSSPDPKKYEIGPFKKIVKTKNVEYKLNAINLEKFTGKVIDSTRGTVRVNGIISPFNKNSGTIPFEFNSVAYEVCSYETIPEIITYKKTDKGNLQIEFRVIDPKEPFNRNTKSNWCDRSAEESERCKTNNNIVTEEILNAPNSYGQNTQEPKYSIKLNLSDIKAIRQYNKENSYDTSVYCDDSECFNSFIRGLKNGKLSFIENDNLIDKYSLSSNLKVKNDEI